MPNAIDLTTTAQVQLQQLDISAGDISGILPPLITAISRHVLSRTGRRSLNLAPAYVDLYDGQGGDKQFVKDYPIKAVSALSIFGAAVPPSSDGFSAGFIFDEYSVILLPGTSVGMPGFSNFRTSGRFPKGRRNVSISYTAGYDSVSQPPSDAAYNGAPSDLGQAVTEFVVQQLRRREWVDQANKVIAAGETLGFRSWEIPPQLERVIQGYTRSVII